MNSVIILTVFGVRLLKELKSQRAGEVVGGVVRVGVRDPHVPERAVAIEAATSGLLDVTVNVWASVAPRSQAAGAVYPWRRARSDSESVAARPSATGDLRGSRRRCLDVQAAVHAEAVCGHNRLTSGRFRAKCNTWCHSMSSWFNSADPCVIPESATLAG